RAPDRLQNASIPVSIPSRTFRSPQMAEHNPVPTRRDFMKTAVGGSVAAGGLLILGTRASLGQDKKTVKVGLIGCGGRGTGALANCVEAGKYSGIEVKVMALADGYEDRARRPAQQYGVPKESVFVGFDAYQK